MFEDLSGKEEKKELSAILCAHANENPSVCNCPENCYCQTRTCQDRIGRPDIQPKDLSPEDKCLMCNREVKEAFWTYIWKGKEGYMHRDPCGKDFHTIGYYLLDKAQETLERKGIQVVYTKEKLGIMMIYTRAHTDEERKIVKVFQKKWQEMYPDFDWYFS